MRSSLCPDCSDAPDLVLPIIIAVASRQLRLICTWLASIHDVDGGSMWRRGERRDAIDCRRVRHVRRRLATSVPN